ncbi:MAG: hypothetical protein HY709_07145 [Candidatus Latescibacteria bacterium]|nr:hypothetical protein [Candidatus Latescibacterota bacterium]
MGFLHREATSRARSPSPKTCAGLEFRLPHKEESGTDENGQGMASGVHGYRLEAIQVETLERGFVETKWMLLIR